MMKSQDLTIKAPHIYAALRRISDENSLAYQQLYLLLRWHIPAYFGEKLYFYIFVFLSFIWSDGDHS